MKTLTILVSLMMSTLSFSGPGKGHAHGHGHSHGTTKKMTQIDAGGAEKLAREKIKILAFQKKIDSTWNNANLASAVVKDFDGEKEWFLTFSNEKGVKGKKLYIFLKLDGKFVAANFTGK